MCSATAVCEKNTPLKKNTCEKMSFQIAKSGAGEQFLSLDCRARAPTKGVFYVYIYIYREREIERERDMCVYIYIYR